MTTTKRTLPEYIGQALLDSAQRILRDHPDEDTRERLAEWMETAHERITIVPTVDRRKNGRIDTRSYALEVWLTTDHGPARLCTIRRRHIAIPAGVEHDDPQTECRTLLHQLGYGIPDTPEGLT